jgi:hypothetical protein
MSFVRPAVERFSYLQVPVSIKPPLTLMLLLVVVTPSAKTEERPKATMTTPPIGKAPMQLLITPDNGGARGGQTNPLAPGLYKAAPYSMLVYVPPAIDTKIAISPRVPAVPPLTVEPTLRLVPARDKTTAARGR